MINQYGTDIVYNNRHCLILLCIVILGFFFRIWGLGSYSLRGDEEIMALAASGVLETGFPIMPSGLFYTRAPLQVYMIATSIDLFGLSEWALRLPSVLVGTMGIVIAFYVGKRFLNPMFNLLFVFIIAVNPWLTEMSQTARMYIFFSTATMLYAKLIFNWEENNNWRSLFLAILGYFVCLHFYPVAIFFSFLFFYPALIRPTRKRIFQASIAFSISLFAFRKLNNLFYLFTSIFKSENWLKTHHGEFADVGFSAGITEYFIHLVNNFVSEQSKHSWQSIILLLLCLSILSAILYLRKEKELKFLISFILFFVTVICSFTLNYHLAFVLYFFGAIFFLKYNGRKFYLLIFSLSLFLLLLFQFYEIFSANLYSIGQIGRMMIGRPSIFPFIVLFEEFPLGFILMSFFVLLGVWEFIRGQKLPGYFIFFIISVWTPLLAMGIFKQWFPPRFIFPYAPFFIVCTIAGLQYLINLKDIKGYTITFKNCLILLIITGLIFIYPLKLQITTNLKYKRFPDHRGAAEAMKQKEISPNDIIIAEDVLQQTFYLGGIDYWLRGFDRAKNYVRKKDGELLNVYTNVPLIGTGEKLEEIIKKEKRGAIYIIGSGETVGVYHYFLSNNIWETLQKYNPEIVFTGKDNMTKIWYLPPVKG